MISVMRVFWNSCKVFLAFISCTLLFYYGLQWLNDQYQDYHRYDEPEGRAVKVFEGFYEEKEVSWIERLHLFYEIGE